MPFIPHSEADTAAMLAAIGVRRIEDLFDEIPTELRAGSLGKIPEGLNEQGIARLMRTRAATDGTPLCFAGAGSYEHHIPAAVWEITTRGEFYSAYTPYQAEASQGTLQLIYEYQTMMTRLTGMDVSNASMYDGATALAEAVLMAERTRKKPVHRVLIPRTVNPLYRKVVRSIVTLQNIEIVEVPFDAKTGKIGIAALDAIGGEFSALVIPQPNYFGVLEDVDALTEWAHAKGALAIAVVNPITLGLLKSPGTWGGRGVDICCGDGQPLGVPMSSGGPYFGFLTCKKEIVRQMPGRIVGRTTDLDGREGFALTLQAREQHIRRAKATSNICTNQGLLVTAATIYMSLVGPEGLKRVAASSAANTRALVEKLTGIRGVRRNFASPYFHESALDAGRPAREIIEALAGKKILAGVSLGADYPELGDSLLVCATETKTADDLEFFSRELERAVA